MVNTGVPKSEYRLFSSYQVARKITENGEFYGLIKDRKLNDRGESIVITPYLIVDSKYVFFENVYINLNAVNEPWTAAGKFLQLFKDARHMGDFLDRVIGIEVKLNEGKNGKVYKNVVDVFLTDEDDLIFDDEHIVAYGGGTTKTRTTQKNNSDINQTKDNPSTKSKMQLLLEEDDED